MVKPIKDMPHINLTINPNYSGTEIIWEMRASDGTKASGFAKSPSDAMRDATSFVDAMMQPRRGGLRVKPGLRVVGDMVPASPPEAP